MVVTVTILLGTACLIGSFLCVFWYVVSSLYACEKKETKKRKVLKFKLRQQAKYIDNLIAKINDAGLAGKIKKVVDDGKIRNENTD